MANKKKKRRGLMQRTDIPFAQRLKMQHETDIVNCRNHSAQIVMFCTSVALHEIEGIGYKRLTEYSLYYKKVIDDFYVDIDVGMAHVTRRMEQMGMPISGEFYSVRQEGLSCKDQQLHDHTLQAAQVAQLCNAVAMNDFFGFGRERQERISERVTELTGRYAMEGQGFLLEKMQEIGFDVVNGHVMAYADEGGKAVIPSRARKEGWA